MFHDKCDRFVFDTTPGTYSGSCKTNCAKGISVAYTFSAPCFPISQNRIPNLLMLICTECSYSYQQKQPYTLIIEEIVVLK